MFAVIATVLRGIFMYTAAAFWIELFLKEIYCSENQCNRCTWVKREYCREQVSMNGRQLKHGQL
jgi:hypothetical protein